MATLIVAVVLAPLPMATAQEVSRPPLTDAQKQKTTEHYEKATRLYNVGKYSEAIAEYEAAYLVSADPVMLFNIAQCHRLANQPEEAARFYKNYLRNAPQAPNRPTVEQRIAEMERLSEERRRLASAPPASTTPSTTTSPPATGATPPMTTTSPVVTGPPPGGTPPPGEPVTGVTDTLPRRPSRVLPYTLLGVGGGVLLVSFVAGAVAASKAKQVEDRSRMPNPIFNSEVKRLQDDGRTASGVAVVTGLTGLAVAGTGLYFLLRSSGSSEASADAGTGGPSVYPIVGSGVLGGGARFGF